MHGPISDRLAESLARMADQIETGLRMSDYYPVPETVMGPDCFEIEVTVMRPVRTPDVLDYQACDWREHTDSPEQVAALVAGA